MRREWLQALSRMTYGIYVLTAAQEGEYNGMIASWVSQVSFEPPLILAAVHPNRYTHSLMDQSGAFALHALHKEQRGHLDRFKGDEPQAKFHGLSWSRGETGSPVLDDCLASYECRVRHSLQPGNHTLFIGEIVAARLGKDGEPLTILDYQGTYLGCD